MEKIYCVEDDENIRELVLYALGSSGFQGKGFPDGQSFREAVAKELPDLVLLDIMLPGRAAWSSWAGSGGRRRPPPSRSSCSPPRPRNTTG